MKPSLKDLLLTGAILMIVSALVHAQNQTASKDAGVISGTVSADNGSLTNARVTIGKMGANVPGQTVRVDSKGSFQTAPLEPGLYYLGAYVPGLIGDPSSQGIRSYYRPGDTVNFKLIKGGVITGSVKNANGDALIAMPVRAIMVRNRNGDPVSFTTGGREVLTDDRGIYRLYGLPPGTYIVSAGGSSRSFGPFSPTAYEAFVPTYAPSATRDTATEISLNSGDEAQADIQFREERGHVISGTITGTVTSDGPQQYGAGVVLYDARNHAEVATGSASGSNKFSFA
ncbi:MAG TPA: carboxypeptidase-like regulatory domain-containing protein, partial [Pyrinomonadaceae bacterium]|nr:carboxypeptidase-like regulatory domain-containing protein [Pyrinomonadaceae bacterium]